MTEAPQEVQPHHPLTACGACPLYEEDSYVPTRQGAGGALLLGQAPGAHELRAGYPLAGPSGKVTAHALAAAEAPAALRGATLSNAVSCVPKGSTVPGKALKACAPRVRAEVAAATVVVALGKHGAQAALGRTVEVNAEATTTDTSPEGTPVIIAPNPAAVLRAPGWWPDLVDALARSERVEVGWEPPPAPAVVSDPHELLEALRATRTGAPWMLDVESTRAPAWQFNAPTRLRCVGIGTRRGTVVVDEAACARDDVARVLTRVLEADGYVAHNLPYDYSVLRRFGIGGCPVGDTQLKALARDERLKFGALSLESLAYRHLGAPPWKPRGAEGNKDGAWYDAAEDAELYAYNGHDVGITQRLDDHLDAAMSADERRLHDGLLLPATLMLARASDRGAVVDSAWVRAAIGPAEEAEARAEAALGGINPRSGPQVVAAFHDLGIDLPRKLSKATGEEYESAEAAALLAFLPGVDLKAADAMDALERYDTGGRPEAELARLVLIAKAHRKLLGTYLRPLLEVDSADGRVHPSFRWGTETGRLSASKPNIQNVPRRARDAYTAAPGHLLVQVDLKQAELYVIAVRAAEMTGDTSLLDVLVAGDDVHAQVAAQAFGSGWTKEQRVQAKRVVFGSAYGAGVGSVADSLGVSADTAARIQRAYFARFPAVPAWQRAVRRRVIAGDHLVTPYGRRRRLPPAMAWMPDRTREDMVREALAFEPQSIANDINLHVALAMERAGIGVDVLVHDSNRAMVLEADAREVAELLPALVAEAGATYTDRVAFRCDVEVGRSWGSLVPAEKYWEEP